MGWCHEFGCQIEAGCDHPMQAGQSACTCAECGVVCNGRFESCSDVWARGPITLIEAPVRAPTRPIPRRREVEVPVERSPVPAPAAQARPEPARADAHPDAADALAWLRREFAGLHARLQDLSDRVARQETMMAEVASDQASEINVTLADLESCAGELRNESQHLRDLREAMTEAVPPMVDAAARHAVTATASGLASEMRTALTGVTEHLPNMVDASVKQAVDDAVGDLRTALSGMVEASVQQAVGPAVESLRATSNAGGPAVDSLARPELVSQVQQTVRDSIAEVLGQTLSQALSRRTTPPAGPSGPVRAGDAGPSGPVRAGDAATTPARSEATPSVTEASAPPAETMPGDRLGTTPEPAGPSGPGRAGNPVDTSPAPAVEATAPPVEPPPAPGETSPPVAAAPEAPALPGMETGLEPSPALADQPAPPPPFESPAVCTLPGVAVGPSLAVEVSAALGRARIRRRRLRQAGPPAPGLYRRDPFAGRTVSQLERYALGRGDLAHARQAGAGSGTRDEAPAEPLPPTLVAAGERDGQEVPIPLDTPGGIAVVGPDAVDACRALLTTFLARAEPPAAEVAVVGDLLGEGPELLGLARVRSLGPVLDRLEPEVARRSKLLRDAGVPDVAAYRARYPHELLPALVVVADAVPEADAGRLGRLVGEAAGLGVAVILVDTTLPGFTTVRLQPGAVVDHVSPRGRLDVLDGVRLYSLSPAATGELLSVLAGARTDQHVRLDGEVGEAPFAIGAEPDEAPIQVSVLGTYRIEIAGQEIRSGLRAKARELLAFYLLHPEGTTLDAATEALWPEADPGRGSEWFWTALGNLRSLLRNATGQRELKVIERFGDQYRIEPLFDVDLWRFQRALGRAGKNGADATWATAVQEAADLYRGDLLAGADWAWAEVPRDDLRRRAVDILVSLAASRQVAGDVRGALGALQRAVQVDPLAEQLYRRIMRLYSRLSRPDDVGATFQQLKNRLAEVGLEPTTESTKLSVELCGAN